LRIMFVLGARPQFVKSAPVIHELLERSGVELQLVHSGQHYDYELSRLFFEELELPPPLLDLRVGSGSHAVQTGRAMIRLERCMIDAEPDLVLVPGDTNTTLAAALAAAKLDLPVAHVEAGARSFDMSMPEEVNRRVADHLSRLLFAPTETAVRNLRSEGIPNGKIYLTGDTMVDALRRSLPTALRLQGGLFSRLDLEREEYVMVTAHRPGNVDDPRSLRSIVEALVEISGRVRVVFPVHPRTMRRLRSFRLHGELKRCRSILLTKPLGYLDFTALLEAAAAVLTDSGGVQKEAYLLGTPCATMRRETEWPETLLEGANVLVGSDKVGILDAISRILEGGKPRARRVYSLSPFGDGEASKRIADITLEMP
ncbi:MAG: UDP-N-acetylglucosamine 2-epimerase (non-hydrolyzing), partial [Candidatus Bathyarchaeia archaeon]